MTVHAVTIRVFRRALMLWVACFAFTGWFGLEASNMMAWSPMWIPPGPMRYVTHGLVMLPGGWDGIALLIAPALLIMLALIGLLGTPRWWIAALIWFLYVNLMNKAWLAGSGGQQLMANLLFWNIFLGGAPVEEQRSSAQVGMCAGAHGLLRKVAFWMLRMQLLLAYAATGLHKLTGTHWMDGTAMGIVATDPAFGPAWIAGFPVLAKTATWAVLAFQLTFPIAVWFRRTRVPWMLTGTVFHLGTAIWLDIPEMGLAFIAAYTIWLSEDETERLVRAFRRTRWWVPRSASGE